MPLTQNQINAVETSLSVVNDKVNDILAGRGTVMAVLSLHESFDDNAELVAALAAERNAIRAAAQAIVTEFTN